MHSVGDAEGPGWLPPSGEGGGCEVGQILDAGGGDGSSGADVKI